MTVENILKSNGLRITESRVDLLNLFVQSEASLSNQDIEEALPDADRITMYRTLKSFEEKGIIHRALDHTQTTRYALCHSDCSTHDHHDNHVHFHCDRCDNTYCVEEATVPYIKVPEGYEVEAVDIIMNGTCDKCKRN